NAPHVNNVELGRHGRNRTNVWDYAGVNTFRAGRLDELAMHPTVKPVALVADVIRDASCRSDLGLDPFAGSGITIIAVEKNRPARLRPRNRPSICRCYYSALASVHGQTRSPGRDNGKLRRGRRAPTIRG